MRGAGAQLRRARSGLSVVEVLISTTLSALLLIAVATAWSASTQAVENNDEIYRSLQAARVAMLHMTTEVRRCQAVQAETNGVSIITFDGHNYTYQYQASTQQLQLVDNDVAPGVTYVLANNVSSATFTCDSAPNPQTEISCVVRVAINITVTIKTNSVTLNGSAVPRINVNY